MISNADVSTLQIKVLKWWRDNGRSFPWRNVHDPFKILISEVLLHRTRADRVVPIYLEFLNKFPTVNDLVRADATQVGIILYPLGLFWRSKLILKMAKEIVERFGGEIPQKRELLESLPGVGPYIASAVRCFAFGYPEILLDVNTARIIGRLFDINVTDSSRRKVFFKKLYKNIMEGAPPREFNYAMIDLGAIVCGARVRKCNLCPVLEFCKSIAKEKDHE